MTEGVIKFKISEWNQTGALDKKLWHELEECREKLYEQKLIGFDKKNNIGYGNMSVKLLKNEFIITGSQTGHLQCLNGERYCIIQNADFETNSVYCRGPVKPSSESITHAACYYSNSRINAVIHIHSKNIWKNMIEKGFLNTPENAEYGSRALSESIKNIAERSDRMPFAVVMKGHEDGIIIAGKNIKETADCVIELYNSYK